METCDEPSYCSVRFGKRAAVREIDTILNNFYFIRLENIVRDVGKFCILRYIAAFEFYILADCYCQDRNRRN